MPRPASSSRATLGGPSTPIIHDPTAIIDGADVVLVESTYGGREHEPDDGGRPTAGRGHQRDRRLERRAAHPVVRHRSDAGGRVGHGPAAGGRADPARPALPRLADGLAARATSTAAFPATTTRRRIGCFEAGASPLDYPDADVTRTADESKAHPDRAAADDDRGLQRHAHRRPCRPPPAQPHRRSQGDDPVRGLPGRGHARRASPGRRHDRSASTADRPTSTARSARSAASAPTPTSPSCSTGCATSRRRNDDPDASSSSMATRRPSEALEPTVRALGLDTYRPSLPRGGRAVSVGGAR